MIMAEDYEESDFSLSWTDHLQVLQRVITALRYKEQFADVTLVCNKKHYPAHKFVLAMCSSYFEELFEHTPAKHPIIVLAGIPSEALEKLLDFMYLGQAEVHGKDFDRLLEVAQELRIRGLMNTSDHPESQVQVENQTVLQSIKQEVVEPVSLAEFPLNGELVEVVGGKRKIEMKELDLRAVKSENEDHVLTHTVTSSMVVESSFNNNVESRKRQSSNEICNTALNKCSQCEKCFESEDLLNYHKISHIEDKFFTCSDCPYKTLNYNDYKTHTSKHAKSRPYACPYCPEKQVNKELHISHQQKIHPTKEVIITRTESLFEKLLVKQDQDPPPLAAEARPSPFQQPPSKMPRTSQSPTGENLSQRSAEWSPKTSVKRIVLQKQQRRSASKSSRGRKS
ncbi:zinc finger and BTB domain-containing protein 24-like [Penaeus chinensis]|uniref:zinc finger and BTB domain-containing protein 24-like n=1 Tax=Penaeus chinensis TaxID=139456 RepID=UPI001FB6DBCE|nr:zinc finger and BTB domain-containing protein 24-like [Penaeus chinensis]